MNEKLIEEENEPTPEVNMLSLNCKYCSKKYKSRGALKNHEEIHISEENVTKSKGIDCSICGKSFKYPKILLRHEKMHSGEFQFWCKLCAKSFETYEEKVGHNVAEHQAKGRKKKCRVCVDLKFDNEDDYIYHVNEFHKDNYDDFYMCSDCGKQFKTKSELSNHNSSKCGTIKQYKCQICGQELMTAGSLHNHMLRHNGSRSSMCGYCGKLFLTIGQLKVHERTHTQEKAFVCNVCGKGFCHRQSLITHSTLHTGVKPYQCENCGHSFSCVGNLIKHRRTHADTCGLVPLTTHRVKHPSTKMKVKLNTPANSKLKSLKKELELKRKLDAYKQKLNENHRESDLMETDDKINESCSNSESSSGPHNSSCSTSDPKNFLRVELDNHESNGQIFKNSGSVSEHSNCDIPNTSESQHDNVHNLSLNVSTENSNCNNILNRRETSIEKDWLLDSNCIDVPSQLLNTNDVCKKNSATSASEGFSINDDELDDHHDADDNHDDSGHSDNETDVDQQGNGVSPTQEVKKCDNSGWLKNKRKARHRRIEITEDDLKQFMKERGLKSGDEGYCKYCNKFYNNMKWLLRHEKEHSVGNNGNSLENTRLMFRCSCCKSSFETKEEVRAHQQLLHSDVLTCQECEKIFSNTDSLRSHQNIFHKGIPRKVYTYVCEKCGLQFRQKAFLYHHEKNNCGSGPIYECHVCGRGFNSIHTRRSHLRIHDPKKRFLCKFCGKNFRWKGQLKIHERSHTGEKPFACLYCPKAFAYRESLVTHSSLHTGIKPHLCEACGSRFSCIGNLIKHRATHASTCGAWYLKNQ